jgi:putative ABC transport system substrate-binding protein
MRVDPGHRVMERRTFMSGVTLALLAVPLAAEAQPAGKIYRVGFLNPRSGQNEWDEAFRQALGELGYVEGRNLIIAYRWGAGNEERLAEMAAELVQLKVDIIVAAATVAIQAAKRATNTIPIVMAAVSDPVGIGIVASLSRPGGNVTGLTLMTPDLAGKRLQWLREIVPKTTRVAILGGRGGATRLFLEQMRAAAEQTGVQLVLPEVGGAEDLAGAFTAMQRERAQALIVEVGPLTSDHRRRIVELAAQYRLPAMYEVRGFVESGGLMSYGPSIVEMYRRTAVYVAKILKGAKPADLPVEQPEKFELVINLKTAKALGLTIPQSVLGRADEVIQ